MAIQGDLNDEFSTYGVQYTTDLDIDPADAEATDNAAKVMLLTGSVHSLYMCHMYVPRVLLCRFLQ
jgi:hypothetical protein